MHTYVPFWWQRTAKFWNSLAGLPDASVYKQVALDGCREAVTRNVQNWAGTIFQEVQQLGYAYSKRFYALLPSDFPAMQLLDAPAFQARLRVDVCTRACPPAGATLRTTNGGLLGLNTCGGLGSR